VRQMVDDMVDHFFSLNKHNRTTRRVMEEFYPNLSFIMGTVSHEMNRFVIDGSKVRYVGRW